MQLPRAAGLFLLQAGAEQVSEQVVITPPAAHLVQRASGTGPPSTCLEQRLATRTAGDRVHSGPLQPLQHRGLQQEHAQLLGLALEHLLGQVVQDVRWLP